MSNFTRAINKLAFQVKKHAPEILTVVGIGSGIAATVAACKATTKVQAVLAEAKEQVNGIHTVYETPEMREAYLEKWGEEYTEEQKKKDLAVTYAKTGLEFVKLYAPAAALGALSIGCVLTSGKIMKGRNLALTAAYAAADKGFKEYRGRLIDRFGKELDHELRYNVKTEEVKETIVNEKGEEETVTKTVKTIDPEARPTASVCFCEGCKGWDKDPENNRFFLMQVQNWANDRLRHKGHLFINEIYDQIGIPRTREGNVIGWVYDEKDSSLANFVDFGLDDLNDERKCAFNNRQERSVWLDFNYDGDVFDLMK